MMPFLLAFWCEVSGLAVVMATGVAAYTAVSFFPLMPMTTFAESSITVAQRFNALLENLKLTDLQRSDGITKHGGVRACLNRYYFGSSSTSHNGFLAGSWGKSTEVRPPRDIDLFFVLPSDVYHRFEKRPGNKQSQLLQEVRYALLGEYPDTDVRGDGPVVSVPFASFKVEVVPAFELNDGRYWICETNGGGRYKTVHPKAEIDRVQQSNSNSSGNTRDLIRLMKCWQGWCNVPIKSFWIELLATRFLQIWPHAGRSAVYYDWMVRDFFAYLNKNAGTYLVVPGITEMVAVGYSWKSRAESAYGRAVKACENEAAGYPYSAGAEWQKIFGTYIPVS